MASRFNKPFQDTASSLQQRISVADLEVKFNNAWSEDIVSVPNRREQAGSIECLDISIACRSRCFELVDDLNGGPNGSFR